MPIREQEGSLPAAPALMTLDKAADFFGPLLKDTSVATLRRRLVINDPVIQTWVLSELIVKHGVELSGAEYEIAVGLAPRSAYVRRLLYPIFLNNMRFDVLDALKRFEQANQGSAPLTVQLYGAVERNDHAAQLSLLTALYLETGDPKLVADAYSLALSELDIQEAWRWALRRVFTYEGNVENVFFALLAKIAREDRRSEYEFVVAKLQAFGKAEFSLLTSRAQQLLWAGQYRACVDLLEAKGLLNAFKDEMSFFSNMAATCYEKMRDYRKAAEWYQVQNNFHGRGQFDPRQFITSNQVRGALQIGELPSDERRNHFIMTGFPRSGTTLLENALSSHPGIVTCEETSSLSKTFIAAYLTDKPQTLAPSSLQEAALRHRALYYKNLDRYVTRAEPSVVIDKTPILSASIAYLEKIFPGKKYIFSIRHPYDVIISNFKQNFHQNPAMAAFNDMHHACALYDFVMSSWFTVFPGETERVCYVRYENLVENFDQEVTKAISFLGLEWTDDVKNFAENAKARRVKTPSYAKVRQGLGIGIQSSWRNYDWLFDDECRALLEPWRERFGYSN